MNKQEILRKANQIAGSLIEDVYTSGTLAERLTACANHGNAGTDGDLSDADRAILSRLAQQAAGL